MAARGPPRRDHHRRGRRGHPRPALLLLGLGPWHQWRISLLGIGPRDELVPIASAQLGSPADARMFTDPDSGERFVLAITGGAEVYLSDETFGRGSPYGWAHGLYVLRADRQTRRLEPVAALHLPRPRRAKHTLVMEDLDGDGRPEILVGQEFLDESWPGLRRRTLVVAWRGLAADPLVPVFWLPGCVRTRVPGPQPPALLPVALDHDRTVLVEVPR